MLKIVTTMHMTYNEHWQWQKATKEKPLPSIYQAVIFDTQILEQNLHF
jgi:hypothetical protein